MKSERKRFTLDLDVPFQRRLKVIAALRGVSMRQYCLAAIEIAMGKDQAEAVMNLPFGERSLHRKE